MNYQLGQCLSLRRRHWLVEDIKKESSLPLSLEIACLDDDAQGNTQNIIPDCEIQLECIDDELWANLGKNVPTDAKGYSAYLQSIQWNTATAADNHLFQAPFRAGIEISPYQLAPLAKALDLPRVNLMVADDVGLGKTIEAALVIRELMLRRKLDFFVVAAPANMTQQWKEELLTKFGLKAEIIDNEYFYSMRAQRGFSYNPWSARNAYIISHNLLIDPNYTDGLNAVLADPRPRSMLILDEAHHAAPSHGQAYAVDSQLTRSIREIARRFEHRMFLTATPHNGHSNSFAALLEMLDPQRFTRGIEIQQSDHDAVMIRRLKSDLRELTDTPFPKRNVEAIAINNSSTDAPELKLAELLVEFMDKSRNTKGFIHIRLQQRLLSSVHAFNVSLKKEIPRVKNPDAKEIMDEMLQLASKLATKPDAKSKCLCAWIKENMGISHEWNDRRLIIFTEYRDTLDWLYKQIHEQLTINPDDGRVAIYSGETPLQERETLKARFNADPASDDLRILLCTDSAREGINLQHRCYDLFHFDLPWNPAKLEQRNGRIDRRLQPAETVNCRYFVYTNRPADRVLDALVRKTERINRELGEIGKVLTDSIEKRLTAEGITNKNQDILHRDFTSEAYLEAQRQVEELRISPEKARRQRKLENELQRLESRLEESRKNKNIAPAALQSVFIGALEKLGSPLGSKSIEKKNDVDIITIPSDGEGFKNADWTAVFDEMRVRPIEKGETKASYRENASLKRVSFQPVKDGDRLDLSVEHLHLEHRLVKRLMSQYEAQGFRSRLEKTAVLTAEVDRARVVLLARLTLYAKGASSLHSQIIPVIANVSKSGLQPLKSDGRTAREVLHELTSSIENAISTNREVQEQYRGRAANDAKQMRPLVEDLAKVVEVDVKGNLLNNGDVQAASIEKLLLAQKDSILSKLEGTQLELLDPAEKEQRNLDEAHWQRRLSTIDEELVTEPDRVRERFAVTARRLEPIGLVYLLPDENGETS